MASPLDTSVVHFHSGMPNMPVLNGLAGTLLGVLDLLVNGGDLKIAASLQVVGGMATLGFTGAHAAQASPQAVIEISGVTNMPGLNGRQKVASVDPGVLRFPTTEPDGTAEGTIIFKMAGAGWEWVHSGTNKGFLRSASPQRHGQGLRIDDTAGNVARVVGYESMSDVDTGGNPFPSATQVAGGAYWWKSSVATAAAVYWELIGDQRAFYLGIAPHSAVSSTLTGAISLYPVGFGDLIPISPAGNLNLTFLCASTSTTMGNVSSQNGGLQGLNNLGFYLARSADGGTVSFSAQKRSYVGTIGATSGIDTLLGAAGDAPDNAFFTSRMFVAAGASNAPRLGDIPGMVYVPQNASWGLAARGDTADGAGEMEGRLMRVWPTPGGGASLNSVPSASSVGLVMVDVAGPWR